MSPSLTRLLAAAGLVGAIGMLCGVGAIFVSNWWVHQLGSPGTYDSIADVPTRDIAIVPGVGGRHGKINDYLNSRLSAALALYRAHKVKAILMSGVARDSEANDEVVSSRIWLQAHGVDAARIVTDPAGFRTLDTMQRAARVYHVTNAIICSQPQYLDRSLFLARKAGIDAVGFTARTRELATDFEFRIETAKRTLAFLDVYVSHRGPRVTDPIGLVASAR